MTIVFLAFRDCFSNHWHMLKRYSFNALPGWLGLVLNFGSCVTMNTMHESTPHPHWNDIFILHVKSANIRYTLHS